MFRPSWKSLLIGTVVATTLATGASQADACWGWGYCRPVSWACAPCYTPSYTVSYDACRSTNCGWYVGYRPGPIRRLLLGPYRWYYGGWSTWSSCSWDVCCTGAPAAAPTPATRPVPTEARKPAPDAEPAEAPSASPEVESEAGPAPEPPSKGPEVPADSDPSTFHNGANSGMLTIWVPTGTKVFINGLETKSTGSRRQYVCYGLNRGLQYKYEVRAEVLCERKVATELGTELVERRKIPLTRTVVLRAGDHEKLAFSSDVITYWDPTTRTDRVVVLDDLLRQSQGALAAAKRSEVGPRPPEWPEWRR